MTQLNSELEADLALVKAHYLGDWKPDSYGLYVWAGSLKGGECTPIEVRGWGYLTGRGNGALRLEDEQAKAVQLAVSRVVAAGVNALLSGREADTRKALFMCAASCQGGHSDAGQAAAAALGIPFPVTMSNLIARATEEGLDPAQLWPWAMKEPKS